MSQTTKLLTRMQEKSKLYKIASDLDKGLDWELNGNT